MADSYSSAPAKKKDPDKTFIETALKRFKLAEDAEGDNRKRGLEADRFSIGEQWPQTIKNDRDSDNRPCLVLNQIPKFLRQVTNDQRMNRPAINVKPVDDSSEDTAEILQGLIRHIEVSSNADVAYDMATDSQARKGWGYIRILTEYSDPKSFDQDIKIKHVKNAFTIYVDPNCQEPDYSDAKWMFVVSDMMKEDFEAEYPDSELVALNYGSIGDTAPGWMDGNNIRVAEYWLVEEEQKTIYQLADGSITDQKPEDKNSILKERETTERKVCCYKINGIEKLEENDWAGNYIPIVPVLGEDIDIDGKRILKGMVEDMMDPQRQYNYWTSAQTEAIALAPKAPFVLAEGQQTGYESIWNSANQKNFPYLVYKPVTIGGNLAPPPQRQTAEPPVQAMMMAVRQAAEDLKGTTGIFDANLGNRSNETSGKAIMARKQEGDVSTFHFVDNLSRALRFLGVILLDLIPKIYDAPRVIRIVHEDGTHESVPINQHFVQGQGTQNPVQKIYDVTTGKYDVVVTTGPSFMTKRMEAVDSMTSMVNSYPQLMQIAGDLLVKNMDWPGAHDVAERLKKMLPPQLQNDDDPVPPQAQAQMQQMHTMILKLTDELNKANGVIKTKQMEIASKEKIAFAQMENNTVNTVLQQEGSNNLALMQEELTHAREGQSLAAEQEMHQQQLEADAQQAQAAPQGQPQQ